MICPGCRKLITDNNRFCPNCGYDTSTKDGGAAYQARLDKKNTENNAVRYEVSERDNSSINSDSAKSRNKRICPNCGVELLSNMTRCPRCKYDLAVGKVTFTEKDRLNIESIEAEKKEQNELAKQRAKNSFGILCTNGPSFEGYRIIEYRNTMSFVSSEYMECYNPSTKLLVFDVSNSSIFRGQIIKLENQCYNALCQEAVNRGCNAIICLDYEITSIGQFIIVSGKGTAVIIEKNDTNKAGD